MSTTRRAFLARVGDAMLAAGIGPALAAEVAGVRAFADDAPAARLSFGRHERLAAIMQETAPDALLPKLVGEMKAGTSLADLLAAGALANARSFGGQDYIGYHTFMALRPASAMAEALPEAEAALPVLKVLHRNASRIQAAGAAGHDALHPVEAIAAGDAAALHAAELAADMPRAEGLFAGIVEADRTKAFETLQTLVDDEEDVHRVVLAWRAWDTLALTGPEHAHTLLRQSVRYCVDVEQRRAAAGYGVSAIRDLLPRLVDEHRLDSRPLGDRRADDAWIESFGTLVFRGTRAEAAAATAGALAEGFSAESIGEGLALAATKLVLFDPGREERNATPEKPAGCVHGDSMGVHASDAANAWRGIAAACSPRTAMASLIVAASHGAGFGARFPAERCDAAIDHEALRALSPDRLLTDLDAAIRAQDQARACAIATCYGTDSADPRPLVATLLRHSVRADGALHAEKYWATAVTEFSRSRPAFRWLHLAALARVVASESGHVAPASDASRELLGLAPWT